MINSDEGSALGGVSLWLCRVGELGWSTSRFSASEIKYSEAIGSGRRYQQYVTGHNLIRSALDIVAPGWSMVSDIGHQRDQAPVLEGQGANKLWFNISHSQGLCGCLVSTLGPVGLDIELPARRRNVIELAKTYFSEVEADYLSELPEASMQAEFYRLWTLKESYIKARKGSVFDGVLGQLMEPLMPQHTSDWFSYSIALDEGYSAFTAEQKGIKALRYFRWREDEALWTPETLPLECYVPKPF